MIFGFSGYTDRYRGISPLLDRALDAIENTNWACEALGRHDVDVNKLYINYQRPRQHEGLGAFEAHNAYIDLQYILDGDETIHCASRARLREISAYDAARDIQMYEGEGFPVHLQKGDWVLLFPEDAHAPCAAYKTGECVKLVAKLSLADF